MAPLLPPIKTRVAGISFENRDGSSRQAYARLVRRGDRLRLRREPENPHDGYALAVEWLDADGRALQLGYVPRALSLVLAPLVDAGAHLEAEVLRKAGGIAQPMGVRIAISGELGQAGPSDLEPAIARALVDDGPDRAPALGGVRATTPSDAPSV
ncbi:MAG TPA: HIRAN domain-containing protein [Oscillatoriaceae cyanobacterium]